MGLRDGVSQEGCSDSGLGGTRPVVMVTDTWFELKEKRYIPFRGSWSGWGGRSGDCRDGDGPLM